MKGFYCSQSYSELGQGVIKETGVALKEFKAGGILTHKKLALGVQTYNYDSYDFLFTY